MSTPIEGTTTNWKPREFPASERLLRIANPKPPAKLKSKITFPAPKTVTIKKSQMDEAIDRLAKQQLVNHEKKIETLSKKYWKTQERKLVPKVEEERIIHRLAVETPKQRDVRVEMKRKTIYDAKVVPRKDGRPIDAETGQLLLSPGEMRSHVERLAVIEPARSATRRKMAEAKHLQAAGFPLSIMDDPPYAHSHPASSAIPGSPSRGALLAEGSTDFVGAPPESTSPVAMSRV